MDEQKGLLIVVSGPSGAGKGTVGAIVREQMPSVKASVSVTTRAPRVGEKEGVHYYFRTLEQYQRMIAGGEFLETAEVYCNYYGTPKAPVLNMLAEGSDVLFDIDTMGAKQIKKSYPDCVSIFIMTPSMQELSDRLRARKSETDVTLKRRLESADKELAEYKNYDYFVINNDQTVAARQIIDIILAEKCKTKRNETLILKILGEKVKKQ